MTYQKPIRATGRGRNPKDIAGQRFGMLTALCTINQGEGDGPLWLFLCDCGSTYANTYKLARDRYSCGCARKPRVKAPEPEVNSVKWKKRRLYQTLHNMKSRCYRPKDVNFHYYGGRGITVCDEWRSNTTAFVEWALANGYEAGLTIDRINVHGNYEPLNCRFVDMKAQNRNRSNTVISSEDAEEIKRLLAAGEKPKDIARTMGLSDRWWVVYNIKNNGAWGDKPRNHYKDTNTPRSGQWKGDL